MNGNLWYFAVFFLLLDLGLVAVRASVLQVRLNILAPLSEKNPKVVGRTLKLLEKQHLRAGLRAGLILTHLVLGVLCWMWANDYFDLAQNPWWTIVVMLVMMTVLLGIEFALEGNILKKREIWALRLTPLGEFFDFLFRPYSWAMDVLKASPEKTANGLMGVTTDEELKTWVGSGQSDGALEMGERKMIYSVLEFGDTLVREIMVPRIDVYALEAETTLAVAIEGIKECGHSRVPVYDDVVDNIIGLLYAKDLLLPMLEGKSEASIRGFMRPVYFVPEAKRVDELLREMQERSTHMAVVVDEYGGIAGILTLEDIVEEIFGEIRDEYDASEEAQFEEISSDEYTFQGRMDLDDLNDVLGTHFTKEVADTLGGYIYGEIGHVPVEGEKVLVEDWELVVEKVTARSIRKVRAKKRFVVENEEEIVDEIGK